MYAIIYVLVYACMPWATESSDMLAILFALIFPSLFSCMTLTYVWRGSRPHSPKVKYVARALTIL